MHLKHQFVKQFFMASTPEILEKIDAAPVLFVAVAATAPSITTPAMALGNNSVLANGQTAAEWGRENDCKWNTKQRLRAIAIQGIADIDLDLCTPAQRQELHAAIAQKPVFIDDATTYLGYLAAEGHPIPEILDLGLVVRILYPDALLRINDFAAAGCEASKAFLLSGKRAGFNEICLATYLMPQLKKFPSDREWSLGHLGHFHQDALSRKSLRIRQAFAALVGTNAPVEIYSAIMGCKGSEEFVQFMQAQEELAQMHARGIPVSTDVAQEIERESYNALAGRVQDLIDSVPDLEPLRGQLESVSEHATAEIRKALGAYAASVGQGLECGADGLPLIGSEEVILAGHKNTPGLVAWASLESCKRAMRGAVDMRTRSKHHPFGRRIHPITAITAVTGRTTCKWPNAQGLDEPTKAIVQARPGNILAEADFGAIEIRIIAAQCVQAMNKAQAMLEESKDTWIHQALRFGADSCEVPRPAKDAEPFHKLAYYFQQSLRRSMPLVQLLRSGMCPHNYTAANIAIRRGDLVLPAGVSLTEFMATKSKGEMKSLISGHRDAAKLMNLGLIYLRTARGLLNAALLDGLDWTLEDAEEEHQAWFDQFPEVAFAGALTLALSSSDEPREMFVKNRYTKGGQLRNTHWNSSQTLSGRYVVSLDDRIINARAQGSGADILMRTLATLPERPQNGLVMVVHDSLVFEVPTDIANGVISEAVQCMTAAAAHYLEPYGIPVDVEVTTGRNWAEMS